MRKILLNDVSGEAATVLRAGWLVMHPTETCYGLAVDIFNEKALDKLYFVKGMQREKPLNILVADLEMAQRYGEFSDKALELARKYWPGPLSIVVKRREALPKFFNISDEFVSMRVSGDSFCREMVRLLGRPVTTTSANLSGEPALYEADVSALREMAGQVDLVVDGGKLAESRPSTLVKVVGDEVALLRQGDIKI